MIYCFELQFTYTLRRFERNFTTQFRHNKDRGYIGMDQSNLEAEPEILGQQDSEATSSRQKSSQRMRYEAELELIKKNLGQLEGIRHKLGLSKRKMCQLLMVDPSAWTRWSTEGNDAPPHIYRALQWYMALMTKDPAWHPANTFGIVQNKEGLAKIEELKLDLDSKISTLHQNSRSVRSEFEEAKARWEAERYELLQRVTKGNAQSTAWKLLMTCNAVLTVIALLFFFFQ